MTLVQTAFTGCLSAAWTGSVQLTKLGLEKEGDPSAYYTPLAQLHFQSRLQLPAEMLPPGSKAPGHSPRARTRAAAGDSDLARSAALPLQRRCPERRGCSLIAGSRLSPRTEGHDGSEGASQPQHSDLPSSSFGMGLMCESCL